MIGLLKKLKPEPTSVVKVNTCLTAKLFDGDGNFIDQRIVKDRVVTNAFVAFVVDQLQTETSAFGDFKYHDSGTGVGAEAAGDTALGTAWGGARSVGTQIEGATANIYKSVATTTYTGSFAITEHGLFNAAAAGTLMDRTVFTALNVINTWKIEWTFQITFTAGG